MYKITTGSFEFNASTKEKLLEYINDKFNRYYNKIDNALEYKIIKPIKEKYFKENFVISKEEAKELLNNWNYNVKYHCGEYGILLRAKIQWYTKYGEERNLFNILD